MGIANGEKHEDNLADFTQDRRILILSLMAVVVGVMGALVADALVWLIAVITNLSFYQEYSSVFRSPLHHTLGFVVIVVPAIGGIIVGLMARFGSDRIRGHGIPEALEAILFGRSKMDAKVAILKPLSSAVSIGTGGPFGAEGPIIMTGGAFGSLFAQMFHLSASERKALLVAGAAAGMSAIFASPIAAVLLAVELLLFEWRPKSLIPVAIASAVAAALRVPLLGPGPIFPVPPHQMLSMAELGVALLLGIGAGLVSGLLTEAVYGFEDLFAKLPIHWMWWPAIGGLAVGIGGLIEPRVLGVGYDTIHDLLKGNLIGAALLSILIGKFIVWSLSLGSGTSGGVLAPLLMMGGALGALAGHWIPVGDVPLWASVGMASMMAGTMRSPFTGMVFTLELTHDINVLPALLIGTIAAHATTVLLLRRSILTEKVARRGYHVYREYTVDPLTTLRVEDVMDRNPPRVPASTSVAELFKRISDRDPELTRRQATLLVDHEGGLVGIITRNDLFRALESSKSGEIPVIEAGSKNLIVTYPDEVLHDAVMKMAANGFGRLPVVSRSDQRKIVGYIGRSGVMLARQKRLEEEHVREKG